MKPFRDRHLAPPEGDPYDELSEFGVHYDSSMKDVHSGGIRAQRSKALTAARSSAWRRLRSAEKRFAMDLLYYQPDPAAFEAGGADGDRLNESGLAAGGDESLKARFDVWDLLRETLEHDEETLPPLPAPTSFLEGDK